MSASALPSSAPRPPRRRRLLSFRLFLLLLIFGVILPFSYLALKKVYSQYVELSPPQIELTEIPRGIGMAPVTLRIRVTDIESGLDELIVRATQRGRTRELFKSKLKGVQTFEHEVSFAGSKSNFQEGTVDIEIVSFDRAFWSNRSEKVLKLTVDYRKPKLEVMTTQHNARRGGSQLVFYRAFDEDVALSGIRVGSRIFQGFRAKAIDPAFEDPNLWVAIYAIDINQDPKQAEIRAFAEDQAGNAVSTEFYNKIFDRPNRNVTIPLNEEFLRTAITPLYDLNAGKMANYLSEISDNPLEGDVDPLVKNFKILNEILRRINQSDIAHHLGSSPRYESFLKQFFLRQQGTTRAQFGDTITFTVENKPVSKTVSLGTEFTLPAGQNELVAVNDGIVISAEDIGVYGRTVIIDHGLGITSLYAHLDQFKTEKGQSIKRGEPVGTIGRSGLSVRPGNYVEMRVQGVPVDPVEWWEASWFNQHIIAKIDDMKVQFGIQTARPLKLEALP